MRTRVKLWQCEIFCRRFTDTEFIRFSLPVEKSVNSDFCFKMPDANFAADDARTQPFDFFFLKSGVRVKEEWTKITGQVNSGGKWGSRRGKFAKTDGTVLRKTRFDDLATSLRRRCPKTREDADSGRNESERKVAMWTKTVKRHARIRNVRFLLVARANPRLRILPTLPTSIVRLLRSAGDGKRQLRLPPRRFFCGNFTWS